MDRTVNVNIVKLLALGIATTTCLMGSALERAQAGEKWWEQLPSPVTLHEYGCDIRPIDYLIFGNDKRENRFRVRFWASHKPSPKADARRGWTLDYSYREKMDDGLADCSKYMKRVKQSVKAYRKSAKTRERADDAKRERRQSERSALIGR